MRNLLTKVLLSLGGVTAALLVVEAAFRLLDIPLVATDPWNDRPSFYYSPEASPNLQDYLYASRKGENIYRIAVVGDSFTFGPYLQFDDTFVKRLERMLNLNTQQRRVEVINYGVPRYSTSHEKEIVRRALEEEADLVLLQITLNDPERKPYRPTGLLQGKVNRWGQLVPDYGIYRYWKSLAFVRARLYNAQTRRRYTEYFFDLFEERGLTRSFIRPLTAIAGDCKNKNVPLLAVVFPLFGVPLDESYPFLPLHQKVSTILGGFGVRSLDLYPSFKGLPIDRLKVMPIQDFHPNEIGHRIAAEAIYRWLVEQNVLPADVVIRNVYRSRIDIRKPPSSQPLPDAGPPPPAEVPSQLPGTADIE